MEKHTIDVPSAEAFFVRPRTRRDFFKALAGASLGAAAGATVLSRTAQAQGGDLEILNFALVLELLEARFYQQAVGAGILSGDALAVVQQLADTEQAHADVLTAAIQGAGGTPTPEPQFTFPPDALSSQASVLQLAATLEPVGVGAYLGAGPMISDPTILEVAGSIAGIEGEHVVAINNLLGVVPPSNQAFAQALTMEQVLAAIAPFLGMAPSESAEAPPETAEAPPETAEVTPTETAEVTPTETAEIPTAEVAEVPTIRSVEVPTTSVEVPTVSVEVPTVSVEVPTVSVEVPKVNVDVSVGG